MSVTVLIADDDSVQRRLLEANIERMGYDVIIATDGLEALAIIRNHKTPTISLIILDLVMPELDGIAVLLRLRELGVTIPVIVQTGQGGIDTVINAMRAGAFDFFVKPVAPERLQVSIHNALRVASLEGEFRRIKRSVAKTITFDDIIAQSESMQRVVILGKKAAQSNIPIMIEGESGVGKETLACAIRHASKRSLKPFITVNCEAISENLIESILFGCEKNTVTGTKDSPVGKFCEADGGTLFLDEIGAVPLDVQFKILQVLQKSEIGSIRGKKSVKINVRLISATSYNLIERVKAGKFREDLYYYMNVFPIYIPPLRDRREDIPHLVKAFMMRFILEEGRKNLKEIAPSVLEILKTYNWSGNIRQLENTIFRAIVMCNSDELRVEDFPQISRVGANFNQASHNSKHFKQDHEYIKRLELFNSEGHIKTLANVEREFIEYAMKYYGGQMSEVARRLGIGRSTLYRKCKEYGIFIPESSENKEEAV